MTVVGRSSSRFDRIGPWIGLPLLGLVLTGLLFVLAPEGACDESADGEPWAWVLFVWGVGLSVACLVGAGLRLVQLRRGPRRVSRRQCLVALALLGTLAVLASLVPANSLGPYWDAWTVAVPATGLALLVLSGATLLRRRADDVGLLLPAYLLGAGIFVFPSLALLTALIKSDALCG
jgi:hypothetical protein